MIGSVEGCLVEVAVIVDAVVVVVVVVVVLVVDDDADADELSKLIMKSTDGEELETRNGPLDSVEGSVTAVVVGATAVKLPQITSEFAVQLLRVT